MNDQPSKPLKEDTPGLQKCDLVCTYPFADLQEVKPQYRDRVAQARTSLEQKSRPAVDSVGASVERIRVSASAWVAGHISIAEQSRGG